jgi:transposase
MRRAIEFFASCGVTVEAVMTDEAMNYTRSNAFSTLLATYGIRHQRTGPYRPRINGKVERFLRTLLGGVGVRADVHLERREARDAPPMGASLRSAKTPHGARRQAASHPAVNDGGGNYI